MKKKISSYILFLLIFVVLAGCSSETKEKISLPDGVESPSKFRTAFKNEIYGGTTSKKEVDKNLRKQLEDIEVEFQGISDEETCKGIEDVLKNWASTQDILKVEDIEVEFERDDLLMVELRNKKAFDNLSLVVKIFYDHEKIDKNEESICREANLDAYKALDKSIYALKIGQLNLGCYSLNGTLRFGGESGSPNFPLYTEQESNEYAAQTIVFNYVKNLNDEEGMDFKRVGGFDNATLRRFGIKDNELYIEIPIYDFDYGKDVEEFKLKLKEYSKALYEKIVGSPEGEKYLKDNGANSVTISFYIPWDKEIYQINSYELE